MRPGGILIILIILLVHFTTTCIAEQLIGRALHVAVLEVVSKESSGGLL